MNKCIKCSKIFVPIPGDDRDESFCLRCERNELNSELERLQKQFGTCSVCGYVAWKDKDLTTEECQFCKLKKQAAEMKDTLMLVWKLTWESLNMSRADYMQILKRVEACKSIEFSQGYLSPAKVRHVVKPLVEFAEGCVKDWSCDVDDDGAHLVYCRHCAALDVLSQAKSKGLA